jgi:hypothetical protein
MELYVFLVIPVTIIILKIGMISKIISGSKFRDLLVVCFSFGSLQ